MLSQAERDFGKKPPTLKEVVKQAIGTSRTQAKFAKDAGISVTHLNRLINQPDQHPSIETLQKIAAIADNGIRMTDLMEACGMDISEIRPERKKEEMPERKGDRNLVQLTVKDDDDVTNNVAYALEKGVETITDRTSVYDGPWGFIEMFDKRCQPKDLDIAFAISRTVIIDDEQISESYNYATHCAVVTSSWRTIRSENICRFLWFYVTTANGKVIPVDFAFDLRSLVKFGVISRERLRTLIHEDDREDNIEMIINKEQERRSPEKRLLDIIFGKNKDIGEDGFREWDQLGDEKYEHITEGMGFAIKKHTIPPNTIEFLKNHEYIARYMNKNAYGKEILDIDKVLYENEMPKNEKSLLMLIASIINAETCLPFQVMNEDIQLKDEEESELNGGMTFIMVPTEEMYLGKCMFDAKTMKEILNAYAKELGIKKYGYYYHKTIRTKMETQEYSVE